MGKQAAGFHPASYALWYEHAAGVNPTLSEVLVEHLASSRSLTDSDVRRLYARYIAARDREIVERIEKRLASLLMQTSQVVMKSGAHITQFGASLESTSQRLQAPESFEAIHQIVSDLLIETHEMRVMNVNLSRQLDNSAQEVLTLTERLERVQVEAFNDPLTGLLNRRGLDDAILRVQAEAGELVGAAVLLIDIDRFKQINDSHGHLFGDQVLRAIAQVLRARIKGADIASRLGGDEFAVVLPDTSMAGALALAEQIRTTLLQHQLRLLACNGQIGDITLSIGVSHAGRGASLEAMIQRADAALYSAKQSGRNCVSLGE